MLLLLLACGPDPELVAERDTLRTDLEEKDARIVQLESDKAVLKARSARLEELADALSTQVAVAELGTEPIPFRLETSEGTLRCTLWPADAPQTVLNFVELATGKREWVDPATGRPTERRLYDGTTFHRVIPGFMIQGGDPLGTGEGGPGYRFKDEITEQGFDEPGLLAMANTGPNTNGSQFFITEGTPTELTGKHTIFGRCADLAVVRRIARVPTGEGDKPMSAVTLNHVVF